MLLLSTYHRRHPTAMNNTGAAAAVAAVAMAAVAIITMDAIATAVHRNKCNVKIGMARIIAVSTVHRMLVAIINRIIVQIIIMAVRPIAITTTISSRMACSDRRIVHRLRRIINSNRTIRRRIRTEDSSDRTVKVNR